MWLIMELKNGENSQETVGHFLVKHRFEIVFFVIQAILIVLFGLFTTFGPADKLAFELSESDIAGLEIYPYYQDINVMMFLGFGFLMTFLRSHAWTSIGLNFLISVLVIQVYILSSGLWTSIITDKWELIEVNIETLVLANFCVASVLIAFGGVLGKMSPFQLMAMALCQTFLYALNEAIFFQEFEGTDAGGSIVIHTFGAYFGLTTTWVRYTVRRSARPRHSATPTCSRGSGHFSCGCIGLPSTPPLPYIQAKLEL